MAFFVYSSFLLSIIKISFRLWRLSWLALGVFSLFVLSYFNSYIFCFAIWIPFGFHSRSRF